MSTVSTVVNEVIVTGRVKRRLIDQAAKLWQRLSYWTKASDVEFDDGKTAEEKIGNINGITSDFSLDDESICASASMAHRAHERFDEFTDGGRIISIKIGDDGKPYIVYKDGADTVLKKLGEPEITTERFFLDTGGKAAANSGTINVGAGHSAVYMSDLTLKYGNSIGVGGWAEPNFSFNYNKSTGIVTWKLTKLPMYGGFIALIMIDF